MFNILEHLDKLDSIKKGSSYEEFYCPVCLNENFKVTISGNRAGAFQCWNNCCDGLRIKEALGCSKELDNETKYVKPTKPTYQKVNFPVITEDNLIKTMIYDSPTISYYWSNKYQTQVRKTIYNYSKEHRIMRIDYWDNEKNRKRKQLYPQNLVEGEWVYERGNFGFYNQEYLLNRTGYVFIVEGEKNAAIFTSGTGWLSLSPPGFGWTTEYLGNVFRKLYWAISGVIFIADNDIPGRDKAWKIQQSAWSAKLPCKLIQLPQLKEGEDVADLIEKNVDVNQLILEKLNND